MEKTGIRSAGVHDFEKPRVSVARSLTEWYNNMNTYEG